MIVMDSKPGHAFHQVTMILTKYKCDFFILLLSFFSLQILNSDFISHNSDFCFRIPSLYLTILFFSAMKKKNKKVIVTSYFKIQFLITILSLYLAVHVFFSEL